MGESETKNADGKILTLVIYDISDTRKRTQLAKYLGGFGFRVQKSAFEANLTGKLYRTLLKNVGKFVGEEDNLRVYKITGSSQVTSYGKEQNAFGETAIIV